VTEATITIIQQKVDIEMSEELKEFEQGTTKIFSVILSLDGANQNITADTVTFTMKRSKFDSDSDAIIQQNADVTTNGATGEAIFTLLPATTQVAARKYYYDITWTLSGGAEYVPKSDIVTVLRRVSDV
jgi:hypothetical protein